ncbi:hypothetical protein SCHPADRAFT_941851 [Schizopora paradoxa]|uniref:DUF6533 domain-containing protein n=1 Tax=Schizopora paradoxa TaxID=27342 RepID=A0A0H2S423_9AGAM|nr:hypothetical protein SCHPADRAFT_941851 [Schizopora paradoxa]
MDSIVTDFRDLQIYQYTMVATFALICYEYFIKLEAEVRYLWGRRFSFGGALLAMCRYLPFANYLQIYVYVSVGLDPVGCVRGYRASACVVYVEFILSVTVLFTRAYAVWGGTRSVFTVLAFVYAGSIAGAAYSLFLFFRGVSLPPIQIPDGCLIQILNDDIWIALALLIFCESLALSLLLVRSLQHARDTKSLHDSSSGRPPSILTVMARDGMGYFACTLVITTSNLVVLARVTPNLRDFLLVTQSAIQGILCSRLLFHIHTVNEFPGGTSGDYSSGTDSSQSRSVQFYDIELANRQGSKAIEDSIVSDSF